MTISARARIARQMPPFGFERGIHRRVGSQRMRAAGLAKTPQQHGIGGFQKGNLGRNHAPHRLENARQLFELRAFANIHHQRRAADLGRLQRHLGEARDQFDGKVIDAVVAQIFKSLEHRRFARAAHARDDHQFRSMRRIMPVARVAFFACALLPASFLALRFPGFGDLTVSEVP